MTVDADDLRRFIPNNDLRCVSCGAVLRKTSRDPSGRLCGPCRRKVNESPLVEDVTNQMPTSEESIEQLEVRLRLAGIVQ